MAMHLDHVSISSPNLYYGAHRLRLESTLSFYDGGHSLNGDHANRIFPLGANTYLELGGIVNAESVADPKNRPWWYRQGADRRRVFYRSGFPRRHARGAPGDREEEELHASRRCRSRASGRTATSCAPTPRRARRRRGRRGCRTGTGSRTSRCIRAVSRRRAGRTSRGLTASPGSKWAGPRRRCTTGSMCPPAPFPSSSTASCPACMPIGVKTMKGGEIVIRRPSATEYDYRGSSSHRWTMDNDREHHGDGRKVSRRWLLRSTAESDGRRRRSWHGAALPGRRVRRHRRDAGRAGSRSRNRRDLRSRSAPSLGHGVAAWPPSSTTFTWAARTSTRRRSNLTKTTRIGHYDGGFTGNVAIGQKTVPLGGTASTSRSRASSIRSRPPTWASGHGRNARRRGEVADLQRRLPAREHDGGAGRDRQASRRHHPSEDRPSARGRKVRS